MKRLSIALALLLATTPLVPASSQYVLNLREADIRAFIEDAARVTGRTFIIDQTVQGKVSVVTQRPLSRSEYFEVFLQTLRANGLVAVPGAGGALRIQPVATAATSGGRVGRRTSPNGFVTEIIRLRNIEPASAIETVRPLVSREGSVTASRNSIVIADFADNVSRIRQIIGSIDRDTASTRTLALQNAGAREIAEALTGLAQAGEAGRGAVSIVPIDSANSIALRGDAATVSRLIEVARELDRRAASGTEIRVIFLQHADAAQLLPVIQQLLGQAVTPAPAARNVGPSTRTTSTTGGSRTGGTTSASAESPPPAVTAAVGGGGGGGAGVFGNKTAIVTRFEGANAIVIAGPADVQRQIGEVIRQLDQRRQQVLVEAIIVEIGDTAAKQLGVQLLLAGTGGTIPFAATNYSNASPNILTVAGAIAAERLRTTTTTVNGQVVTTTQNSTLADTLQEAAAAELLGTTGGLFGLGFRAGNAIFGAILNAVQSDNASNLLATPSVVTLDNQEARFLAGQEVPITTGEALSDNFDNAFRTVQRQNVGISLEVTPQIGAGDTIKLDIRQEVSSVAGTVGGRNSADLILNKREISNSFVVDNGDIMAIGGLLNDNERRTLEKIPFLGDIPVVGNLFKSRGRQREKTNLMVFIRPTIIRTAADAQAMTDRRYGYVRAQQYLQNPTAEPSLDELVREYMGALPPGAPPPIPAPLDPKLYLPSVQPGDAIVGPTGAVATPPSGGGK